MYKIISWKPCVCFNIYNRMLEIIENTFLMSERTFNVIKLKNVFDCTQHACQWNILLKGGEEEGM